MSDNITASQGTGTTLATDDISGVHYPRVKISWGVDGAVVDASASNPFPVVLPSSAAVWQAEGSITAASLTTAYATAFTAGGALVWAGLRNNTNGIVVVSLDGGSTSAFTLDSGDQVSLDLKSLGKSIASSTDIQAKYSGSAPTTGSIRVNGFY